MLNLRRNVFWSTIEIAVTGVSLFLLYKFVLSYLGTEALGLWSLVLATTSLARVGDLGVAAGLSRYVALSLADGDKEKARGFIDTAFIANLALYGLLSVILFAPLYYWLGLVVPQHAVAEARTLLPFTILSFIFMNLNNVMFSSLIGQQRTDMKCQILIASLMVQVALAFFLIPHFALLGVAWAQIGQYIVALFVSWMVIRRRLPGTGLDLMPIHFSMDSLRILFSFGVRLQALGLANFFFEPLTKFVLSGVGGLSTVGLFELSYRLALQVRNLIGGPVQTLLPAFVHLWRTDSVQVASLYRSSMANVILLSVPLMLGAGLAAPIVGWLWLGRIDTLFLIFTWVFCGAWFVNLVSAPGYILGVSAGVLKWNFFGVLITSFCGPAIGYSVGSYLGPLSTVLSAAMGLAVGSALAAKMNCLKLNIEPFPKMSDIKNKIGNLIGRLLGTN